MLTMCVKNVENAVTVHKNIIYKIIRQCYVFINSHFCIQFCHILVSKEICIDINVVTKRYGKENSWEFGACSSTQEYPSEYTTTERCCQPEGSYQLICKCSFGDGWHGGYLEINGQEYCKQFIRGHKKIETATMIKGKQNFCFPFPFFLK